jgi:hypothetical protein
MPTHKHNSIPHPGTAERNLKRPDSERRSPSAPHPEASADSRAADELRDRQRALCIAQSSALALHPPNFRTTNRSRDRQGAVRIAQSSALALHPPNLRTANRSRDRQGAVRTSDDRLPPFAARAPQSALLAIVSADSRTADELRDRQRALCIAQSSALALHPPNFRAANRSRDRQGAVRTSNDRLPPFAPQSPRAHDTASPNAPPHLHSPVPKPFARIAAILTLALLAALSLAAQDGKRVALVIGNDAYALSPLRNAVNDARAVEIALRGAGFRTILVENARKPDLESKIGEFLDQLGPDDTALFFYAGHGVQIANENFLIPVDFAPGSSLSAAKFSCVSVAQVLDELSRRRPKKSIVILDACRSNPVTDKYSLEAGLAQPQSSGKDTFVVFSTSPGQTAADNPSGHNSWFSGALAENAAAAGLEINEVFTKVKRRVSDATGGRQTPWTLSSLTSSFYFHAPAAGVAEDDPSAADHWIADAQRRERRQEWASAARQLNRILQRAPGGGVEDSARARLPYVLARRDALDRVEAGDYPAAARQLARAVELDPFAIDAAQEGVNNFLLGGEVSDAVPLLHAIRARGASPAVTQADAMLRELSAVSPQAAAELKAAAPPPPPIAELFPGQTFGVPDFIAANRRLDLASADLSRLTLDLKLPDPEPIHVAQPVVRTVPAPTTQHVAIGGFHVEIISASDSRDLKVRRTPAAPAAGFNVSAAQRPDGIPVKVSTTPPGAEISVEGEAGPHCTSPCILNLTAGAHPIQLRLAGYRAANRTLDVKPEGTALDLELERETGEIEILGPPAAVPIYLNGDPVADRIPATVRVPAGKCEVHALDNDQLLLNQPVDVPVNGKVTVTVVKP